MYPMNRLRFETLQLSAAKTYHRRKMRRNVQVVFAGKNMVIKLYCYLKIFNEDINSRKCGGGKDVGKRGESPKYPHSHKVPTG